MKFECRMKIGSIY